MAKVAHVVDTAGTGKLVMSLEDGIYDSTIGPIVGINKLTGTPPEGSFSETSVNGVRKGMLGSVKVTVIDGTKRRTRRLLCSLEKMDTCITELPGKSLDGKVIRSARFPTRRRLR